MVVAANADGSLRFEVMVTDSNGTELQHVTHEGVTYVAAEADKTFQIKVRNLQSVVADAKAYVNFDGVDISASGHVRRNGWCQITGFWEKSEGRRAFVFSRPKAIPSSDVTDVKCSVTESKVSAARPVGQIKVSIRPSKWVPCLGMYCFCQTDSGKFSEKYRHNKDAETVKLSGDKKFYMQPSLSIRAGERIPESDFPKGKNGNQGNNNHNFRPRKEHMRRDERFAEVSVFLQCETPEILQLRNILPESSGQDEKKPKKESTVKTDCCRDLNKDNDFHKGLETEQTNETETETNTETANTENSVDPVFKVSSSQTEQKRVLVAKGNEIPESYDKRVKTDEINKENLDPKNTENVPRKDTEKNESKSMKIKKKKISTVFIDLSKEEDYSSDLLMYEFQKTPPKEVVTL